jgi:hypothetical protein
MRPLYLLILFCCFCFKVSAGTLSGTVRDSKGKPLPFATVFVEGTTNGTVSGELGQYTLPLAAGSYVVTCRYIGFERGTFTLTIGKDEAVKHDFRLTEQGLEMKEVVVHATDEDPAYRIIREAIKKRTFHLKQVQQFQASIYLKGVLRSRQAPSKVLGQKIDKGEIGLDTSGKGVVYLCEEVADYYAQDNPAKERTIIHSVIESGDPNGLGFSQLPPVISFYRNTVLSLQNSRPLISPIADNALGYYKYKLEGEFKEGRNTIYKIKVLPKRSYEPLCFGNMYIVDGDWAIHSLSLTTSTRYGLELLDTLRIDQQFLPLRKDAWVIKNQQFYPTINIFGFGFTGNFVTVYGNQKVNEPVPDTIFNKKIISTYDKTANKKDSVYWEEARPLPLEVDEARDYHYKDSLRRATEDPHRIDSLRRRGNRVKIGDIFINGIGYSDSGYRNTLRFSPLLFSVNFNSVEGLNLAPEISWRHRIDTGKSLYLRTAWRYGFANTHFNAIGALTYSQLDRTWQTRGWTFVGEGGKYVFQYDRHNPVTPIFNSLTTLFFNYNELKLYERWTGALTLRRNGGNGFRWWARAAYDHRIPLENSTDFTWAKKEDGKYTDNLPIALRAWHYEEHDAVTARIGLSYQAGYHYVQYPDYKRPVASNAPTLLVQYEKGIPTLFGSNTDWDRWIARIIGSNRLGLWGNLDYVLTGGGFLNKKFVGVPDLIHPFAGDDPTFTLASPYMEAFQLMPFYQFSNDADLYGEAHVEYNMQGLLSNKIPGLRQAKWYFILGTNTFYADKNLWYSEVFVSLDNLGYKQFRLLRLDFIRGWDCNKRTYDGIRLGLRLASISGLRGGNQDTEW